MCLLSTVDNYAGVCFVNYILSYTTEQTSLMEITRQIMQAHF
jgi:hypothetical protein